MVEAASSMSRSSVLAMASSADDSSANLRLIMAGLALVAAVAVLAGALALVARGRRHRQLDVLLGALVLWGVVSAGSGLWFAEAKTDWAKQREIRLESGYAADANAIDAEAPAAPWILWGGLAAAYVGLGAWALAPARRAPSEVGDVGEAS